MKLIRTPPELPKNPPPPRAQGARPTDQVLQSVKEAKASDRAKGTGPQRTPKPYTEPATLDVAPEASTPAPTGLQQALHSIGSELLKGGDQPVTMDQLGFAFRHAAAQLGTGSTPDTTPDTGGLLGTPAPEREA